MVTRFTVCASIPAEKSFTLKCILEKQFGDSFPKDRLSASCFHRMTSCIFSSPFILSADQTDRKWPWYDDVLASSVQNYSQSEPALNYLCHCLLHDPWEGHTDMIDLTDPRLLLSLFYMYSDMFENIFFYVLASCPHTNRILGLYVFVW